MRNEYGDPFIGFDRTIEIYRQDGRLRPAGAYPARPITVM